MWKRNAKTYIVQFKENTATWNKFYKVNENYELNKEEYTKLKDYLFLV